MRVSPSDTAPEGIGRASWASLRAAQLITLPAENPIQRVIDAHLDKLGIVHDDVRPVSFLATQISMVEAGFGSAVMPTFAIAACRHHRVQLDVLGSPQVKLGFYRVSRRGVAERGHEGLRRGLCPPPAVHVALNVGLHLLLNLMNPCDF